MWLSHSLSVRPQIKDPETVKIGHGIHVTQEPRLMTGMPLRLISLGFATLLVLSSAIGQVPTPTPDKKAGGRHGKFHFTTDEQIAVDANRRKQIREKLASLRQDLDKLAKDPAAKQRLSSEVG